MVSPFLFGVSNIAWMSSLVVFDVIVKLLKGYVEKTTHVMVGRTCDETGTMCYLNEFANNELFEAQGEQIRRNFCRVIFYLFEIGIVGEITHYNAWVVYYMVELYYTPDNSAIRHDHWIFLLSRQA